MNEADVLDGAEPSQEPILSSQILDKIFPDHLQSTFCDVGHDELGLLWIGDVLCHPVQHNVAAVSYDCASHPQISPDGVYEASSAIARDGHIQARLFPCSELTPCDGHGRSGAHRGARGDSTCLLASNDHASGDLGSIGSNCPIHLPQILLSSMAALVAHVLLTSKAFRLCLAFTRDAYGFCHSHAA